MVDSALVLTVASYTASAAIIYALSRLFRRRGAAVMPALLAATAFAFGLLVLVPGVLHTMAVVDLKIRNRNPYDLRFVFLVTTGLILIHVGTAQIILSRWILRGARWAAAASAGATLLLLAFVGVLTPVNSEGSSLLVAFGGYLALLIRQLVAGHGSGPETRSVTG